jgi:hypothetical protein
MLRSAGAQVAWSSQSNGGSRRASRSGLVGRAPAAAAPPGGQSCPCRPPPASDTQCSRPTAHDQLGGGVGVLDGSRVGVLGAVTVGHRDHHRLRSTGRAAAAVAMGVQVVDGPAAAVEEQRHRQPALRAGPVPAQGNAAHWAGDEVVLDLRRLEAGRVDHELASPGSPGIGYRQGEDLGRPEACIASRSDRA